MKTVVENVQYTLITQSSTRDSKVITRCSAKDSPLVTLTHAAPMMTKQERSKIFFYFTEGGELIFQTARDAFFFSSTACL